MNTPEEKKAWPPRIIVEWDTDERKLYARLPFGNGTGNYLSRAEHEATVSELKERVGKLEKLLGDKGFFLNVVNNWKHSWMTVTGTDEKDRENYFNRAFGVDANMKHDLVRRLMHASAKAIAAKEEAPNDNPA